jgi:hypothetical protein
MPGRGPAGNHHHAAYSDMRSGSCGRRGRSSPFWVFQGGLIPGPTVPRTTLATVAFPAPKVDVHADGSAVTTERRHLVQRTYVVKPSSSATPSGADSLESPIPPGQAVFRMFKRIPAMAQPIFESR